LGNPVLLFFHLIHDRKAKREKLEKELKKDSKEELEKELKNLKG